MTVELKYKDITEKIIGASFEVHKFLGNGFQEVKASPLNGLCYKNTIREIHQSVAIRDTDYEYG